MTLEELRVRFDAEKHCVSVRDDESGAALGPLRVPAVCPGVFRSIRKRAAVTIDSPPFRKP